jgi:hypothetical protein
MYDGFDDDFGQPWYPKSRLQFLVTILIFFGVLFTWGNMAIWYDEYANLKHAQMAHALEPFITELFPGYELSHAGFSRDFITEEVVIKLHLNQKGRITVSPEPKSDGGLLPW